MVETNIKSKLVLLYVREFVHERIEIQLTDAQWLVIDVAMGKYWNNRKKGSWIGNEDNAGLIFRGIVNRNRC